LLSGHSDIERKKKSKQKTQQIGNALGDFNQVKKDPTYSNFKSYDVGYLIIFENLEEAKFLSTNFMF